MLMSLKKCALQISLKNLKKITTADFIEKMKNSKIKFFAGEKKKKEKKIED
jgi:hypothetical protein